MDPEIRDKVIETHTMMKTIHDDVKDLTKTVGDHDTRLRKQETFRTWIIGLFSTGAVGGGSLAALKQFFSGGVGG